MPERSGLKMNEHPRDGRCAHSNVNIPPSDQRSDESTAYLNLKRHNKHHASVSFNIDKMSDGQTLWPSSHRTIPLEIQVSILTTDHSRSLKQNQNPSHKTFNLDQQPKSRSTLSKPQSNRMKTVIALAALAASSLAQTLMPGPIKFTNAWGPIYNYTGTYTLSWAEGVGTPVDLTLFNSTWSCPIFSEFKEFLQVFRSNNVAAAHNADQTPYSWYVNPCPRWAPGKYQLALNQTAEVQAISPIFYVANISPPAENSSNISAPATTATVTYVYWDDHCGCTKTGTAATPLNTGLPVTTTKWWDNVCGCHKSAVAPVSTLPASNYTVPAAPPVTTAAPTSAPAPQPTTAPPATFTGEAVRFGSSLFGLVTLVVAMIVA